MPGGGLGEVKGGAQVDLYDSFPIVLAELECRSPADDAGIVDEYVETAEFRDALLYDFGGELRVGLEQIDVHGVEATALVPDQISGLSYGHDIQGCYVCAGFG